MSVPCPAFFFFEEDDHGSAQGQCARGLPQIFSAVVLKPGLSAYTPFIGGDVHEALESLFVRGGIPAADGGEDDRPGGRLISGLRSL